MRIQIKFFSELTNDELYQILKLRVNVFVVEQNCRYQELDDKDQDALHVFIMEENEVVAYLRFFNKSKETVAIGRILTEMEHREKGLASEMIRFAMDYIISKNSAEKVFLQAQEHLVGYYQKFGFQPVSEMYLEDGIPHVDMEYFIKRS